LSRAMARRGGSLHHGQPTGITSTTQRRVARSARGCERTSQISRMRLDYHCRRPHYRAATELGYQAFIEQRSNVMKNFLFYNSNTGAGAIGEVVGDVFRTIRSFDPGAFAINWSHIEPTLAESCFTTRIPAKRRWVLSVKGTSGRRMRFQRDSSPLVGRTFVTQANTCSFIARLPAKVPS
jgi:hypothetical protein